MHICTHTHAYVYTHTYICIYIYTHTHMKCAPTFTQTGKGVFKISVGLQQQRTAFGGGHWKGDDLKLARSPRFKRWCVVVGGVCCRVSSSVLQCVAVSCSDVQCFAVCCHVFWLQSNHFGKMALRIYMYTYLYVHIHTYIHIHIYVYIYI